jgi:hypothetical protein
MGVEKIPMMEYSAPRRVLATPMSWKEAKRKNIRSAVDKPKGLGFHVKEPVAMIVNEYWMPEALFESGHIRTKMYTIGEMVMLLVKGNRLRRTYSPQNEFLQFVSEAKYDKDLKPTQDKKPFAVGGGYITKVAIYPDPVIKDKHEVVLTPWTPSTDDLFATDWQTVNVDLNNLGGRKDDTRDTGMRRVD